MESPRDTNQSGDGIIAIRNVVSMMTRWRLLGEMILEKNVWHEGATGKHALALNALDKEGVI
jgi:hypothetical protein